MIEKKVNSNFINLARAIGILLVVFGHTFVPEIRQNSRSALDIYSFIYSFHMPLYSIFSGYLFEANLNKYEQIGYKKFIISKFKILIIPYISFSIISYVGINIAFIIPTFSSILTKAGYAKTDFFTAFFQTLTNIGHIDLHLWFIYVLFIAFVIIFPLHKILGKLWAIPFLFILYAASLSFFSIRTTQIFFMIFYLSVGRQIFIINKLNEKKYIVIAFVCLILFYATSYYKMFADKSFIHSIFRVLIALSGSMLVISIAHFISRTAMERPLMFLDSYSYDIYLIHQPFITSGVAGILLQISNLSYPVICGITLILGIFLPIIISKYIIKKIWILRVILLGAKGSPSLKPSN